jgi:hypothetical protein
MDRVAGEILEALEPGVIGLIEDEEPDALEAQMLPGAGTDDLQGALRRERQEAAVMPVQPKSTSPAAAAIATGCADSKKTSSASSPSSAK